jgi:hypothetical protein
VIKELSLTSELDARSIGMGDWPPGIVIGDDPVRRVHTRNRRRNTALVYSTFPLGMRAAESSCEVRFLKVAQLDTRVARVRVQPAWLRVPENGRIRRRAPDFAVMIDGRAELHETKLDAECKKPDVQSELLAIRDEVERHPGWRYSVTLESALLAEPLRSNTDLLWRELVPIDEIDLDLHLRTSAVLDAGPMKASELIERTSAQLGSAGDCGSWPNLLAMIAAGIVDFDVEELLTPDSVVWNRHSGPVRSRTLPFGTVNEAIKAPRVDAAPMTFLSLHVRGIRK